MCVVPLFRFMAPVKGRSPAIGSPLSRPPREQTRKIGAGLDLAQPLALSFRGVYRFRFMILDHGTQEQYVGILVALPNHRALLSYTYPSTLGVYHKGRS